MPEQLATWILFSSNYTCNQDLERWGEIKLISLFITRPSFIIDWSKWTIRSIFNCAWATPIRKILFQTGESLLMSLYTPRREGITLDTKWQQTLKELVKLSKLVTFAALLVEYSRINWLSRTAKYQGAKSANEVFNSLQSCEFLNLRRTKGIQYIRLKFLGTLIVLCGVLSIFKTNFFVATSVTLLLMVMRHTLLLQHPKRALDVTFSFPLVGNSIVWRFSRERKVLFLFYHTINNIIHADCSCALWHLILSLYFHSCV